MILLKYLVDFFLNKLRVKIITIFLNGDDPDSTPVAKPDVHVERVVTLVNQSL